MSDYVPEEVVIQILIRLPIKSLVQCMSVCKSWHSLIESPLFITAHLNHWSHNSHLQLVRSYAGDSSFSDDGNLSEENTLERYSLYSDNEAFDQYSKLEFPVKSDSLRFRIIGSCHGLVLISAFDDTDLLYMWNPSVRKLLTLPVVDVGIESISLLIHIVGFGYDACSNDYKVVSIVDANYQMPPQGYIYSMITGIWRDISHLCSPYLISEQQVPQVYTNGALHWMAVERGAGERRSLLLSFHLRDELFHELEFPAGLVDEQSYAVDIGVIEDSLALIGRKMSGDDFDYSIWVMKEYGVAESWTKLFNFVTERKICLAGFRRRGEILFGNLEGYLVSYDRETKERKHLGIPNSLMLSFDCSFFVEPYLESLLLLGAHSGDVLSY